MNVCISRAASNFQSGWITTVPGPALAFLSRESSLQHESVNETGVQHEPSIYSRLVSHAARAPSLDDIPVHSIRALAGSLVGLSYFVPQLRRRIDS